MPWFEYEGHCRSGTAVTGRLEADSLDHARQTLDDELHVTADDIRKATRPAARAALGEEDFIFFNEQLASMASAGLALDQGLEQLARDLSSPKLQRFIQQFVDAMRQGKSLEEAVAEHESQLPTLYSRVIRAGIQTGQLPATLYNLNQHLRLVAETRRILWEALAYPLVVLVFALLIITGFSTLVIPHFVEIYNDWGAGLPAITVLLLNLSTAFPRLLVVTAAVTAIGVAVWIRLKHSGWGRRLREAVTMRIPVLGRQYTAAMMARFIRCADTGVTAGLALPEALRLAGDATGSPAMAFDAEQVATAIERGQGPLDATQLCRFIPRIFGYTLQTAIGRESLSHALTQLSRTYEGRARHLQEILQVFLLPTAVVVLGLLLVVAILALFLPLVTLVNSVAG